VSDSPHPVWRDDQPCPQWCVTGAEHLARRLRHGMDDFWHEGLEVIAGTQDVDHNWHPIEMRLRLSQHEQVDERGHLRHPIQVDCQNYGLSPAQARELATVLLRLADDAEQAGE
jgi:hypothetical protein